MEYVHVLVQKKILINRFIIVLIITMTFNSCALLNVLLGYEECNYPDCTRECINNCNYCMLHCDRYNVPSDLNQKVDQSIQKQLEIDRYYKNEIKNFPQLNK